MRAVHSATHWTDELFAVLTVTSPRKALQLESSWYLLKFCTLMLCVMHVYICVCARVWDMCVHVDPRIRCLLQ